MIATQLKSCLLQSKNLHPMSHSSLAFKVLDMLRAAAGAPLHLRTSLTPLDEALYGGIPAGSVTEVRS